MNFKLLRFYSEEALEIGHQISEGKLNFILENRNKLLNLAYKLAPK